MAFLRGFLDMVKRSFKKFGGNSVAGKWCIVIATFILFFFILSFNLFITQINMGSFRVGDICSTDIISPGFINYIDEEETKKLEKEAMAVVNPVYRKDEKAVARNNKILDPASKQLIERFAPQGILEERGKVGYEEIRINTREVRVSTFKDMADVNKELEQKGFKDIAGMLEPTLKLDPDATKNLRDIAAEGVQPNEIVLKKGQIVIRRGEEIGPEDIKKIKALHRSEGKIGVSNLVGIAMLTLSLLLLMSFYIYNYNRKIFDSNRMLLLLSFIAVSTLFLARVISSFEVISDYFIPIAFASITITILMDPHMAFVSTVILGLLIGIMSHFNFNTALVALGGGLVGIYGATRIKQRKDLTRVGLYVAGMNFLMIVSLGLIQRMEPGSILKNGAWGIGNGFFLSVSMVLGTLHYFEGAFRITSNFRLMELSDLNSDLLRELFLKATGTYHHSLLVGELAERAASEIGANTMLTRVGGYYHDVGKMENPIYFMENQDFGIRSVHEGINPKISSSILNAHIRDGVEIAKKHGLPKEVVAIIRQHHGTTSKRSFFMTRLAELGIDDSDKNKPEEEQEMVQSVEDEFRYAGPKPQTKEAAIVMLADSVEAATRASQHKDFKGIEKKVKLIISNYLTGLQFEECDLTLRDLNKIGRAFIQVLSGVYHVRSEYQEGANSKEKRETQ